MISLNGVSKKYDNRIVTNNLTYSFDKNLFYCITGASGSGKSTLLYLLSGLECVDSGIIMYNEINYDEANEKTLAKLRLNEFGFVYQSYNLIPNLKISENILSTSYMCGKKKKEAMPKLLNLAERLGIINFLDKYPSQLSGGEQQRVAIARALMLEPKVIFADEPTGNLDTKTSEQVLELMLGLQKENDVMLIMVTHNPNIALKADICLTIEDGSIIKIED